MDEEIQQGVETPVDAGSGDTNSQPENNQPVDPQGGEQPTEQAPAEDKRDWEAYARKLEADKKSLRSQVEQSQVATPQAPVDYSQLPPEEQAINLLRDIVGETVQSALAPLQEEKVWNDFERKPYVSALQPEIVAELKKLPESMPLAQRLETARKEAIVNNLDAIRDIEKETGLKQAYNNQQTKRGNAGLGARSGAPAAAHDSVVDRVMRGENVSTEDYRSNLTEIRRAQQREIESS